MGVIIGAVLCVCVFAFAADPAARGVMFVLVTMALWASLVAVGLRLLERRDERTRIVGYRVEGDHDSRASDGWTASAVATWGEAGDRFAA